MWKVFPGHGIAPRSLQRLPVVLHSVGGVRIVDVVEKSSDEDIVRSNVARARSKQVVQRSLICKVMMYVET